MHELIWAIASKKQGPRLETWTVTCMSGSKTSLYLKAEEEGKRPLKEKGEGLGVVHVGQ
jgi:hypothetical protein